jgi:hypothetical protein
MPPSIHKKRVDRGLMFAELVAQAIFEPRESIPSVVSEYALMR